MPFGVLTVENALLTLRLHRFNVFVW